MTAPWPKALFVYTPVALKVLIQLVKTLKRGRVGERLIGPLFDEN